MSCYFWDGESNDRPFATQITRFHLLWVGMVRWIYMFIYDICTLTSAHFTVFYLEEPLSINIPPRYSQNKSDKSALNSSPSSGTYMGEWTRSALIQEMACRLFGTKPLPEPVLAYFQLDSWEQISMQFGSQFNHFHSKNAFQNIACRNGGQFVQGETNQVISPSSWFQVIPQRVW